VPSKIFVGNLDFGTTKEEVQALFAQAGAIRDVFLPMDRATGRPRGFAFVEFETDDEAASAIERFNGHELNGRALRVNAAEDRPRRGPGGPPSGGGYGGPRDFGGGPDFGGFGGGFGGGGFGGRDRGGPPPGKSKGSRRNLRAKKRSL
jgi:cold-inducible RNA-binding protein